MTDKKCTRCKKSKHSVEFASNKFYSPIYKTCRRCRDLQRAYRGKYYICKRENCQIQPTFGKPGSNKKEYCKTHSPPGYINEAPEIEQIKVY